MRRLMLLVLLACGAARAVEAPTHATAIVTQDKTLLRAAPKASAQRQAILWQGDTLEVRGERFDWLQVYDHRRERAGWVRAAAVRRVSLAPEDAGELLAVTRFLRDTPGAEALGMAYTAAFLKAAAPEAIGSEAFDAFGTFADRLARRASARTAQLDDDVIAAHLEVAASLGATIASFESEGRMQLCYDGEAFRRVLALPATDDQRARAALALTRPECVDPSLTVTQRHELDAWRADVLSRVPRTNLPGHVKNRLRVRNAAVLSALAFHRVRRGEDAADAAQQALAELAAVDVLQLAEEDRASYDEAALRVGASRWAAATVAPTKGLAIATTKGETGQTCIGLVDAKGKPLLEPKCTYGVVWAASQRANAAGTALTLAVQPLEGWRELWVFRRVGAAWQVDVLPPAIGAPELGYLEFAGWVPNAPQFLAAREARIEGRYVRTFELVDLTTLVVANKAEQPTSLSAFHRWQDPAWKQGTVALR
ncbi:MAG TPA: hypothetical protein VFL14_09550 [Xanthomonadales bacterium]|nr:hypothetical protein [Xanthomonadales bacterium]